MSTRFFYNGKELQDSTPFSSIGENKTIIIMTADGVKIWANTKGHVKNILSEYAKKILQSTDFSALLQNWSRSGFYCDKAKISPKIQTYSIAKAITLLKKYNGTGLLKIDEMIELASFVESLASKHASAITFGINNESYDFLFSKETYKEKTSLQRFNDSNFKAKNELIKTLEKTFHYLGTKYVPILITGTQRTAQGQVAILMKKLDHTTDMYQYYLDKIGKENSKSVAYLRAIQNRYDGVSDIGPHENLINSTHLNDINKMSKGSRSQVEGLLNQYVGKEGGFTPSFHMIDTGAVDLRNHSSYRETAEATIKFAKSGYSVTDSTEGDPHVHISLN